jgi:hypothetical protein
MNKMELVKRVARVMDDVKSLFEAMYLFIQGLYTGWDFEYRTW